METFFIAFGAFIIAVIAMAVGVIVRGKALKGSCGGVDPKSGKMLADCLCERLNKPICESRKQELEAAAPARARG
ncbi:MAG: (Na+)-NQR maturation NqrM [Planctomycetota bacterium]